MYCRWGGRERPIFYCPNFSVTQPKRSDKPHSPSPLRVQMSHPRWTKKIEAQLEPEPEPNLQPPKLGTTQRELKFTIFTELNIPNIMAKPNLLFRAFLNETIQTMTLVSISQEPNYPLCYFLFVPTCIKHMASTCTVNVIDLSWWTQF